MLDELPPRWREDGNKSFSIVRLSLRHPPPCEKNRRIKQKVIKHLSNCLLYWWKAFSWLSICEKTFLIGCPEERKAFDWLSLFCIRQSGTSLSSGRVRSCSSGGKNTWTGREVGLCLRGPAGLSVGQSVQEPVDQRWRRNQILQLQVEDSLKALGSLGAELGPQTQEATQRGRGLGRGWRGAAAQVVPETGNHSILQLLHALGVLQTRDLLWGETQTSGD